MAIPTLVIFMKFLPWVLQKVMKQGRNGNVGEFRHMTTSFF